MTAGNCQFVFLMFFFFSRRYVQTQQVLCVYLSPQLRVRMFLFTDGMYPTFHSMYIYLFHSIEATLSSLRIWRRRGERRVRRGRRGRGASPSSAARLPLKEARASGWGERKGKTWRGSVLNEVIRKERLWKDFVHTTKGSLNYVLS